jgi:hypothetical protein
MLFIEVFALTKWGSGETYNQNYQSLGSALVMLAFMSTGCVFPNGSFLYELLTGLTVKGGTNTCIISEPSSPSQLDTN